MVGNAEEPKKVDIDQVTQDFYEALKDGLRIVIATLGDTNGIRLFASFAGLDLQTDHQTPSLGFSKENMENKKDYKKWLILLMATCPKA